MRAYENHFGMVTSTIIAISLSLVMATAAIFVDHLDFGIPLLIRNWGTAFLVITVTGWIFPLTEWSNQICKSLHVKRALVRGLIEDFVATIFFNLNATLVLAYVNLFDNSEIEKAVAAGAVPSTGFLYRQTVLHDLPIMFVISYVIAFFVTRFAVKVAGRSSEINIQKVMADRQRGEEQSLLKPGTRPPVSGYVRKEAEIIRNSDLQDEKRKI